MNKFHTALALTSVMFILIALAKNVSGKVVSRLTEYRHWREVELANQCTVHTHSPVLESVDFEMGTNNKNDCIEDMGHCNLTLDDSEFTITISARPTATSTISGDSNCWSS